MQPHHRRYIDYFEQLKPVDLDRLGDFFAVEAIFIDPFNRVRGHAAIRRIFEHMFAEFPQSKFTVKQSFIDAESQDLVLLWDYRPGGKTALNIEGMSLVQFDAEGLVSRHQDFWDSNTELFSKIPVLGLLVRWLQRRLRANATDQIDT